MRRLSVAGALCAAVFLLEIQQSQGGGIAEDFRSPPAATRPHVWWHWLGSHVSREGIARDLKSMAESGIGGATIFNISTHSACGPNMENSFNPDFAYRNDEYWKLLRFAAEQAKANGIELALHNCPGFSATGGPWITPERSMQRITWSSGSDPKTMSDPWMGAYHAILATIPVTNADKSVTWYRFARTSTGNTTRPSPAEVQHTSLEADKLSAAAMNFHMDNVINPLVSHLGPLVGNGLDCIVMDSYEAGHSDWTDDMFEQFRKRRGYDPIPWLPALAGAPVENADRFCEDWSATVRELFTENHFRVMADRVHAAGMKLHLEPYGGNFDRWEAAACADFPMVEFWLSPLPDSGTDFGGGPKVPGAVGRAMGHNVIGTEAFTSFPMYKEGKWGAAPRHLKAYADATYARGVNRLTMHHWVHQPFPAKWRPGMTMGQWGTHFGENQSWFEMGKEFFRYLGRCQALLQRGTETIDVLSVNGDPGRDGKFDAIPESVFLHGLEVLPGGDVRVKASGRRYRLLEIPDSMTEPSLEVAEALKRYVEAGAHVRAPAFKRARGLSGYPASDGKVADISRALSGKCSWSLDKLGVRPPVEIETSAGRDSVLWNARNDGATDFYFVCNVSTNGFDSRMSFRTFGKSPVFYRPATGAVAPASSWEVRDGRTVVDVPFKPNESLFVVFEGSAAAPGLCGVRPEGKLLKSFDLGGIWVVSFEKGLGAPEGEVAFDGLSSWSDFPLPGIRYFSGTATYVKHLDVWLLLDPKNVHGVKRYVLDLGDVREICSVKVNGVDYGILWYPPYRIDVTEGMMRRFRDFEFSDPKRNALDIEIKVANTWRNRLVGDHLEPEDCEWHPAGGAGRALRRIPDFAFGNGERPSKGRVCFCVWDYFGVNTPLLPAGLLGPVTLEARE